MLEFFPVPKEMEEYSIVEAKNRKKKNHKKNEKHADGSNRIDSSLNARSCVSATKEDG